MSWRIRNVARETGVTPVTLRAWERRYGFPKPERTDGNYRTYSDDEVIKLRHVVQLTQNGLSVSDAIQRVRKGDAETSVSPEILIQRFFVAAKAMNDAAMNDVLITAMRELPPIRCCDEVLIPLLRDMTDRLDVAREHMASRVVRDALVHLAGFSKRVSGQGPIILACPQGEEHEGGLLAVAVHLKLQGERVVVLGANTPTDALAIACKQVKPSALCLSLIKKRSPGELTKLLAGIVEACKVPVVIAGGPTAREHLKSVYAAGAEFAETADEVTQAIEKTRR